MLAELIEELIDAAEDDQELAGLVLARLLKEPDALVELLTPILAREIRRGRRNASRHLEEGSLLAVEAADPVADRMAFLAETFYAPGYGIVSWGEATIEVHQARILYMQEKIDGHQRDVARHEEAIERIRKARTRTLGDALRPRRRAS